ncbi:ParM/StbA family protein [Flavobacterium sp.]|uniref:ParM/StbA family protein n=1 Tax=Flavobacterium sp. TaxID=239 RepID=UPI00260998A3|nr:ParM/StbA family protein [Flavobacterium sp.]
MNQKKSIPVGCDDGHHSVKLVFQDPNQPGHLTELSIKSAAFRGEGQFIQLEGPENVYQSEGENITVVQQQALGQCLSTRFTEYPISTLNRVLVHHALCEAGFGGESVKIVTGLPFDQYYTGNQKNSELIDGKINSLKKPVISRDNKLLARIARNAVVSEGVAALFDLFTNADGTERDEYSSLADQPIAIIDLGGKTLDMVTVMENCNGVYSEYSGTREVGTLQLITQLSALIKREFKMSADPSREFVDQSFKTKEYMVYGEKNDISHLIQQAAKYYMASIMKGVTEIISSYSELGAMVFVGGGAALLQNTFGNAIFNEFYRGKIIIPDRPEFANARGMYHKAVNLEE